MREYLNRKRLEIRSDAIAAGDRILLVDDWIETGAQVRAAATLVERSGGRVFGIAAIHLDRNPGTEALRTQYRVRVASWLTHEESAAPEGDAEPSDG